MPVLALGWAILIGGAALVAVLAILVSQTDLLHGLDTTVARWSHETFGGSAHRAFTYVTDLGETWLVTIVAILIAAIDLYRRRDPWTPLFLLLVIIGDKLLTQELKQLVDRARPTYEPVAATLGPSFPSGHSSTAAASWAAFALVAALWWGRRSWRPLAAAAILIACAVAASRVLLDVHWLTDVIGGLAVGWAWFAACALALGTRLTRPLRIPTDPS